jgi:cellulose synthase/poly-beta-1,6-N-acetylglucosamine synthase-like glycosyltransferase
LAKNLIDTLAILLAAILLLPVAVLCIECLAAVLAPRRRQSPATTPNRPRLAVLIPAHNEQAGLPATLRSIAPQLLPHDRVLVVADNCTDDTASVARANGATCVERDDPINRGKGFALDRGIRELEADAPDIVIMVDADCRLGDGALTSLASQVAATGKPAQAAYVMDCPPNAGPRASISALAFIVKNVVRPLGLGRLGFPCLLTGTGMAFPFATIKNAPLASGNIVEDMQLGIDLAIAGHAPRPCADARVAGTIENKPAVAYTQRTRWEHGHLSTLLTACPRLAIASLRQLSPRLAALALEVAVPPLALLTFFLLLALAASITWTLLGGSPVPAYMLAIGCAALVISTFLAWVRFARQSIPLRSLATVPFYVAWKIPMYFAFLFRRETKWVRTTRDDESSPSARLLSPAQH